MTVDRKHLHGTDVLLVDVIISVYCCTKLFIIKIYCSTFNAFISKGFRPGHKGLPSVEGP